ncbi:hypothetical protein E2320_002316, partial [Naja naja]
DVIFIYMNSNDSSLSFWQNLYQNRLLGLAAMASPSRNSQNRRRCKESLRYSYNPDHFHNMDIGSGLHGTVTIPRSTSDTDLVTSDSRSTLMVSCSYYSIGHSQDLVIYWDIKEEVDAGDWIGMYLIGKSVIFIGFVFSLYFLFIEKLTKTTQKSADYQQQFSFNAYFISICLTLK